MKRVWDMLLGVIVTTMIVWFLLDMIRPYAVYLVIGLFVYIVAQAVYKRQSRW